ncbi:MAG: DUF2089 domain-containing protein [Chloroflexi bacterium]|nr:DUF2089 domain-containing protein [Chloroflexota bacterium]
MAYPVPTRCPVCGDIAEVTRLHCRQCDTSIEGHFSMGRLYELSPEQLAFVELFVRCEGKINRVGEELGVSYPTVRARLEEVIRALGYEVKEEPPLTRDDRRAILEQLAAGEISSEEAIRLLKVKGS